MAAASLVAVLLSLAQPFGSAHGARAHGAVGPKRYVLTLGDSVTLGFQPNGNYHDGYADQFFTYLQSRGARELVNMGCSGAKSFAFIHNPCAYISSLKYKYTGPELQAALAFIHAHPGQVSPVVVELGNNDIAFMQSWKQCTMGTPAAIAQALDLYTADMRQIFAQLRAALHGSADILTMTNYSGRMNQCPTNVDIVQRFNKRLVSVAQTYGVRVAPVFDQISGSRVPNIHLCALTWMCSPYQDFHPTRLGYAIIAHALEQVAGYGAVPPAPRVPAVPLTRTADPVSGTHADVIRPANGTSSYTFTAGASGPATVGACPALPTLSNTLSVFDARGTLLGRLTTTMATSKDSFCNWVGVETVAGHTYKVVLSAQTTTGNLGYSSAWSVDGAPVVWKLEGPHDTINTPGGHQHIDFLVLSLAPVYVSACSPPATRFALYFRDSGNKLLASSARSGQCQSVTYTPLERRMYRLDVAARHGTGPWKGQITAG